MANESISIIKKHYVPLKAGKTRKYKLLGLRIDSETGRLVCPNSKTIANKFLVNDIANGVNNTKSFVFVSHQDPSVSSNSIPSNQRGRIVFTREELGTIKISGDNPEHAELDKALFFHPENISNIDKPWHVRPRSGYSFELLDPKAKATLNIGNIERRNDAENIIKEMKVPMLRDTYEEIFKTSHEGLETDIVRSELYGYVQDDSGAQNFLILNKSEQMKAKAIIREAYDKKFIKKSPEGTSIKWVKGGALICNKLPRLNIDQSFLTFLVTDDGKEILKILKDLTEAKE